MVKNEHSFQLRLIQAAVASCFATAVQANPTGPSVMSGAATFNAVGKNLTVTNSPGAIINWQGFSIRPDEVTRFVQSGAASAVLNRVTGAEHSQLLGQLLSNGKVFLINPNGVTIGAGARIDTAGFVASSLALSNEDFLAGKFRFTDPGSAGKVTNAGTINAHSGGPVYLVAPTVENHGVVTAPNGDVMLAAGKSVELVSAASPHLRVQVRAGGEALNVGQLVAESGRVGLYGAAIRNGGLVSADSAQVSATGTIVLKASKDVTLDANSTITANGPRGGLITVQAETGTVLADGRIEAKGSAITGGDVRLLGTQVGLVGAAAVDASGAAGGGTVLVGGDYQGANPGVQNAARVVLAPQTTIAADATARGDGGRVILWSDEYTGFYGAISARGGPAGGNGGFVETSSKDNLQALGSVDAAAPGGRAGQWLLDPANVTISGGATANGAYGGGNPNTFTTSANNAVANVTTIQNSLNTGTSVTITTAPGGTQAGNITVASAITKSAGGAATLTLDATNGITFNAGSHITSTNGALNVTLNANGAGGITTLRNVDTNGGTLTLNSPGAMTQSGVISGATAVVKQGTGNLTLSQANTYTGATTVQAGTVTVTNAGGLGATGPANATTVNAGATLAINGTVTVAETVTLNGTGVGAAGALQRTGGNPTLSGGVTVAADASVGGAAGTLTLSGVVGGPGNLTKVGAGAVTLSGNNNAYDGTITVNAGTLTANHANGLGSTTGGTTVNAGATLALGGVTIGAEPLALNGATLSRAAGNPTFGGPIALAGNNTLAATAGTLTLSGVISGAGNLTKTGAGTVVLSGDNTYGGTTTVAANGGVVRVAHANGLGSTAAGTTVNNAGALEIAGVAVGNEAVSITGTGGGTGALRGTGTASLAGGVTLTGASTVGAAPAAGTFTLSGVVSGGFALTKAGAGTLVLSGANSYTGATTISAGTLTAANAAALGTTGGATSVTAGATLNVDNVTIAENLTINGNGVGNNGALRGTGNAAVTGTVALNTTSRIGTNAAADTLALSGVVSGAAAAGLDKRGLGTLVLSGANTYAGTTTVAAGTLRAASAGALGATTNGTNVNNGATLEIANVAIGTEAVSLNGTGVGGAGALQGTGTAALSGGVNLATAATVGVAAAADTLTLSGIVAGANALTKNGAGTVVLSGAGANSYSGATTVSAGTLVAAKASALGATASGTTVANGATLRLQNVAIGAEAVTLNGTGVGGAGALQGTGTASLGGAVTLATTSAVGAPAVGDALTLSGAVGGAGGLAKVGAGTVVLSGAAANTYGGTTDVNAGTLRIGSAANKITDASAVTVAGGATLDLNGFSETVGSLAGAGNVTLGAATLTAGGNNASTTFSGVMSGTGGLTKAGTGTMALSGANAYGGATNVNAGTLVASNANALGTTAGGTTVANGATLDVNGVAIGNETVTINGNGVGGAGALTGTGAASLGGAVTVASASRVGAAAGNALTLSGAVNGANALDVAGGGTVAFGAAVGGVIPLAAITSAAGTTLDVNGGLVRTTGTQTYGGPVATGGPTTLQTTNSAIIANGAVTATAGTLTLNTGTGSATMTNAANDFATVAIPSGGAVSLVDQNALALGASSFGTLLATAGGALTVNGTLTASGAGNAIVLAGASFQNSAGAGALVPGPGRWLVYSSDPAANTFDNLMSGNQALWGRAYPAAVPEPGNRYVFTTQPAITFTSTDVAKSYGQDATAAVAAAYVVSGFVNAALYGGVFVQDDVPNAVSGTPAVTSLGSPASAPVAGSPYAINVNTAAVTSPTGYAIAGNSAGQLTIGPAALAVTANNQTKSYGQTIAFTGTEFTSAGLQNGETIGSVTLASAGAAPTASVAGSPYAITASNAAGGTFNPANYTITYNNGTLTVSPAALTVTANNQAKTYGQTVVFNGTEFTPTGLQNGETIGSVALASAGAPAAASVAGSPYAITASNATGGTFNPANYTITYNNGTLTVSPAALTVTANNQAKTYGQTITFNGTEFTSAGLQNGETIGSVTLASAGAAPTASVAGSPYAITASNATGGTFNPGNYTITYNDGTLTVTPAALTVTASNQAKTYGQTVVFTGTEFTSSGLQNGETIGSVTLASAGAAPTASVAGSPYAITASNATGGTFTAGNYTITYNDGVLTVSPAALTVTANNQTKQYGQTFVFNGTEFTSAGLQNGETIGAVTLASAGAAPTATVPGGPYAITASNATGGTFSAGNYTITYNNGVMTVTPLPIVVAANNQAKVYGQPDPTLTFTAPTVNGDVLNGALTRAPGETVAGSPYAITQGTVTNANNPNYAITFVNGQLVITPAPLTIAADSKTRLYGDANPPLTATFTGLTNGDTAAAIPGVTLTTPAVPASNVGNYAINVTSGANANYTIAYVNGQLAITPAPLTIAANDASRPFGAPNPPFTATSTGFKLGQTVADLNGTLVFTTPATITSPPGSYVVTPGGVSSGNYTITFVNGQLVVGAGAPPTDQALVSAVNRNVLLESGQVVPGATTNVEQCRLAAAAAQAGPFPAAQRTLNLASAGRSFSAPLCEIPPQ